jgi:hypothetical protein
VRKWKRENITQHTDCSHQPAGRELVRKDPKPGGGARAIVSNWRRIPEPIGSRHHRHSRLYRTRAAPFSTAWSGADPCAHYGPEYGRVLSTVRSTSVWSGADPCAHHGPGYGRVLSTGRMVKRGDPRRVVNT